MFTHMDYQWMKQALDLAQQALGRTSPNPMVGAVVVKNGEIIARGWHQGPGKPHAEAMALRQLQEAGISPAGATMYVTLEPCSHWGRTPPCTQQIIASQIGRVIAAVQDPNPRVSGSGFAELQGAGIDVAVGLMEGEARRLNRAYFTWQACHRPYVVAKIAQSIDGKVATRTNQSQWITSKAARQDGHNLRATLDAILVGVGTALADDPLLTARPEGAESRYPLRIICDSHARTPPDARCLSAPGETLIATTRAASAESLNRLERAGATIWVDDDAQDRPDVHRLLAHLALDRQVNSLLVEGGPTIIGAFRDADLIDELHLYMAPVVIGGREALSSVGGLGTDSLSHTVPMIDRQWIEIGPDLKFVGRTWREHLDLLGGNEYVYRYSTRNRPGTRNQTKK